MAEVITGMVFGTIIMAVIVAICAFFAYKNNSIKRLTKKLGQKAEIAINSDILIWARHTKNKFLKASLYKYDQNKVFEVDGILITKKALVVVEIKSIKGDISGNAKEAFWIKQIGEKKHHTSNPIIQNDKHIEHIMKMLRITIPVVSLIVYSNRAGSIKIEKQPGHVIITRHAELFNKLDEIDQSLEPRMTYAQVSSLAKSIKVYKTNKLQDMQLHKSITNQNT